MSRIVVFAYACEPGKGSEPGAGWMMVRAIARLSETDVITRANNRSAIEASLDSLPAEEKTHLHFHYVDLPAKLVTWKRGARGMRLYYLLWQMAALKIARGLIRLNPVSLVWHVTFANIWLGTAAAFCGRPFVYGPVGGGVRFPWRLVRAVGAKGALFEAARIMVTLFGRYLNPLARIAWRRAGLILVQNPETLEWLPENQRSKAHLFQNALVDEDVREGFPTESKIAMFAGRLLPWKGVALALAALRRAPGWQLVVFGTGKDLPRLRRLAQKWHVAAQVSFRGRRPQEEVHRALQSASVLIHPSLHEDAGAIVAEAISLCTPVVCIAHGGPPLLMQHRGVAVEPGSFARVVRDLSGALDTAASDVYSWQDHRPRSPKEAAGELQTLVAAVFPRLEWSGSRADVCD